MDATDSELFSEEMNTFERELMMRFEKHREAGNSWYPHELKQMVLNAFECELKQERVIELTKAPSTLIFKWHRDFLYEKARKSRDGFREIRVVHSSPYLSSQERIPPIKDIPISNNVTIKFPNQVEITLGVQFVSVDLLQNIFALRT